MNSVFKVELTNLPKDNRRTRRILDPQESEILDNFFEHNPRPSRLQRKQLAHLLPNLKERTIRVWFQNKRTKMKLTRKRKYDHGDSSLNDSEDEDFSQSPAQQQSSETERKNQEEKYKELLGGEQERRYEEEKQQQQFTMSMQFMINSCERRTSGKKENQTSKTKISFIVN